MTIQLSGLASGLDTGALIDGLVQAERQPIVQLQQRQRLLDQAKQTLSTFSSKLSTLRTAAQSLADPVQFASFAATSTDAAVVATTSGATSAARYSVSVQRLAREQRIRSNAQSSATQALGRSGSLAVTIGGATTTVSVVSTDSLTDIAGKLRSSGARVNASILYDGTNYTMVVAGLDSGAANAVTIAEKNGLSLGLSNSNNVLQTAQDAQLTIDGITVTRPTNSISGAISGVTLALTKTTSSAATVEVKADPDALQKKLAAFVSAYNDIVSAGHQAAGYGETKPTNGELAGDSAIRSVLSRLSSMIVSAVPNTSGKYTSLASAGLSTTRDGTLTLDANKLSAALASDPTAVSRLFVLDAQNASTGMMATMKNAIGTFIEDPSSTIQARIDALSAQSRRATDRVAAMEQNIDAFRARLVAQFSAMETRISRINSSGDALLGAISQWTNSGGK